MNLWIGRLCALIGLLILAGPTARAQAPATQPVAEAKDACLVHLSGIGGLLPPDHRMLAGLRAGGFTGDIRPIDWTGTARGLQALMSYERNREQARALAKRIVATRAASPDRPIYIIGHSGGAGIAVWTLESLPPGHTVDQVILFAPALSPTYDLSLALSHVAGSMYVFSSPHDPVLGVGTRNFGTIDRVYADAAGLRGFIEPRGADARQYGKLIAMPYRDEWMRLGNLGNHIGVMHRDFAAEVVAPLLVPAGGGPTALIDEPGRTAAKSVVR